MKTEFSLPDDTTIRYTRQLSAPVERVWAAHTEPELLRRWMLGPDDDTQLEVCEMEARSGGSFRWVWSGSDGRLEIFGEVLEAEAPRRLVTTEHMGGADWPPTRNVLELREHEGGTLLTGTITYASTEARDGAYASGMADGMDVGHDRLEQVA